MGFDEAARWSMGLSLLAALFTSACTPADPPPAVASSATSAARLADESEAKAPRVASAEEPLTVGPEPPPAPRWPDDRCPAGPIVLSEIAYHPNGDDEESLEFVELANTGGSVVDLAGWQLVGAVRYVFDAVRSPTRVAPGAFLVVAADPDRLAAVHAIESASIAGPWTGKLSNRGETLRLLDATGRTADEVTWGDENPWPAGADGDGGSLQRVALRGPSSFAANWKCAVVPQQDGRRVGRELVGLSTPLRYFENRAGRNPSAGTATEWTSPRFDDGAWKRGSGGVGYESDGRLPRWVRTRTAGNLHSLLLRLPFTIDAPMRERQDLVVEISGDDGYIAWIDGREVGRYGLQVPDDTLPEWNGEYAGVRETAGGRDALQPVYRRVGVLPASALAAGDHVLAIASYNSSPSSSDLYIAARIHLEKRAERIGETPGRSSPFASKTCPPLVVDATREPTEPTSRDPVRLTVSVRGAAARARLELLDAEGRLLESKTLQRIESRGAEDGLALFGVDLPQRQAGSIVRYRIVCTGEDGTSASFPRQGDRVPHRAYYVADRQLDQGDDLLAYRLIWNGRLSCEEGEWLDGATFISRGRAWTDLRLKHRGDTSCWRPKRGLRIAFNKGDLFEGQRRLNFLAGWEDRSMLREVIAWGLYRDLGATHCRAQLASIYGAGDRFYGLFVALESPGEEFLVRNGLPADASLWKCRNSLQGGRGRIGGLERLAGSDEDLPELQDFVENLNTLDGDELISWLLENVDIERVLDYQAVKSLISDEDGFEKNWLLCHWTQRDEDGHEVHRWTPLPWDLDLSFGQTNLAQEWHVTDKHPLMGCIDHPRHGNWNGFLEAVFGRRARDFFVPALYGRLWNLLEEKFAPEILLERVERLDTASIDAARADLNRWPRWGSSRRDPGPHRVKLRRYIEARSEFLRRFLRRSNPTTRGIVLGPDGRRRVQQRRLQYRPRPALCITEISYHPIDETLEFVEIENLTDEAVDVGAWSLAGPEFTFAEGTVIGAGEVFVVARDPQKLRAQHGGLEGLRVFGPAGSLGNRHGVVRLRDSGGDAEQRWYPVTVDSVRYEDRAPWPRQADGGGSTLVLGSIEFDNDLPSSWRASEELGGTPGRRCAR